MQKDKKTHCLRGHEYTEENTMKDDFSRKCRICVRARQEKYRRAKGIPEKLKYASTHESFKR